MLTMMKVVITTVTGVLEEAGGFLLNITMSVECEIEIDVNKRRFPVTFTGNLNNILVLALKS